MTTMPPCIRCHDNAAVVAHVARQYYCKICQIFFDDEPEEFFYDANPTLRIQREEEKARRRRQKR